jgi:hypothetical protein
MWRGYRPAVKRSSAPAVATGAVLGLQPLQFTSLLPSAVAVRAATIAVFAVTLLAEPESR